MPETTEQAEERTLRELEGKNIAHYSVLLSAWIETKMERDKTLVTLSSAAIGLSVTILTTVGVNSIWEIPLFAVSVSSFLITIWSSLVIYQLNSQHIEEAIRGSSERDPLLEKYDKRSIKAFVVGGVSALLLGVLSASIQLAKSEDGVMSKDNKTTEVSGKQVSFNGSVNGVTSLNPNATLKKSLNGVTGLSPQATQQSSQSQSQSQGNTTTSNNNSGSDSSKK